MGKKYNSITWFGFTFYHDEKDGSDITAEDIKVKLRKALSSSDDELKDMILSNLSDTVENMHRKETITCGGCSQTAEIGKDSFSKEDWTYSWIDIPLCDDCYTEVRVTIADRFGIKNWSRIDL
jgi:hypothetical protein